MDEEYKYNQGVNWLPEDDDSWVLDLNGSESCKSSPSTEEGSFDALIRDFGDLGTTPPRTRILRHNLHRKNKDKRSNLRRAYKFAQFCQKSILRYSSPVTKLSSNLLHERVIKSESRKKNNKRYFQKRRESERDFKLDFDSHYTPPVVMIDKTEALPTLKVESSNRFLSLSCKLVKAAGHWKRSVAGSECLKDRNKLHEALSALVKTGLCDNKEKSCRRQISKEEHLWQTELKDLIWLELQAWHAMRTPSEQDKYLCEARQDVPQLLLDILNYRFSMKSMQLSAQSGDSGVHFPLELEESEIEGHSSGDKCCGCLWLFCSTCMEHENAALLEVEMLLHRLELAESLYPSSRALASENPLYRSNEFKGRVKAMCLWFNITRHHRLKLLILGRHLLTYFKGVSSNSASKLYPEISLWYKKRPDIYNIEAMNSLGKYLCEPSDSSRNYRKYIEDVLKVKGLRKALNFLEKIHQNVLRKARIALEKPPEMETEEDEDSECRRYGSWSPEAKSLKLPSFIPAFLFISKIPIDVIHEFLRMRLEKKPENPSVLSIRQLIRELKEGLKLAVLNRQRYLHDMDIALINEDIKTQEEYKNYIMKFDESLASVLEMYLNYIHQWVMLTQKEKIQKNLLEEEWKFIISTAPKIPQGEALAGRAFCKIASKLLELIQEDFSQQVFQLTENLTSPNPDASLRQSVLVVTRSLQTLCQDIRGRTHSVIILSKMLNKHLGQDVFSSCNIVSESVGNLKAEALKFCETIKDTIHLVEHTAEAACTFEDVDKATIISRFKEVLHQLYKFAFEYYKEVDRLLNAEDHATLVHDAVKFSQNWLQFVISYCEKGRGVRPRWANYGLDFLLWLSSSDNNDIFTDAEFENLKANVESGIAHIMGAATPSSVVSNSPTYFSTRARSSSPRPPFSQHKTSISSPSSDSLFFNGETTPKFDSELKTNKMTRQGRILRAVSILDEELDTKRRGEDLIGTIIACPTPLGERDILKPRTVTFTWQRGIKIGQGRFGKVYTAVNNDTGELMAMKEISMNPNDVKTIRNVAIELKIIEGLQHPNLVRYYGTEVHREELLIFMELCTEGTLESLVESTVSGLPEALVRRYTNQLSSAIAVLHQHSIVHRDIKTANIFLTNEGNCLKVGDFGSAVKIKAHTTVPGELKGFVGTQAYMAPEVFMKSNTDGHGRAADIWSLGCVIIEMASGKRPWNEYDSNYQIMFKVGMGESPEIPESLSDEGKNFASLCLRHNPKQRPLITDLEHHNFLNIDTEEESVSFITSPVLEDFFKLEVT